jgi:hypothetical protein
MTYPNAPFRRPPLQLQYQSFEQLLLKDYLPIIGNQIPNLHLTYFDRPPGDPFEIWFLSQSGVSSGFWDYSRAYRNSYQGRCLEVNAHENSQSLFWINFTTPFDFTSLGTTQNNYSQITRTGMYGALNEQLNLVLNLRGEYVTSTPDSVTMQFFFYNGSKYATANYTVTSLMNIGWNKFCIPYLSGLTYYNGFQSMDMETITMIQMQLTVTKASGACSMNLYLQDAWLALPQNTDDGGINTVLNAYYTNLAQAGTCIFVSQYFGNDKYNNGLSRKTAVATIEQAMYQISNGATGKGNIVIIDSAIYKPVYQDGTDIGIPGNQGGITGGVPTFSNLIIQADYLETPTISRVPGVCDNTRIGARNYYRNYFYETTGGAGTIRTVSNQPGNPLGAAYTSIAAAHSAASANDCIQIIDSNVYNEVLTATKNITIEAAENCLPTWKYTGGNNILITDSIYSCYVYGIKFQGQGTGTEVLILTDVSGSGVLFLKECTFTGIGNNSSGNGIAIDFNGLTNAYVENCTFIGNNEYTTMIKCEIGSYGNAYVKNNTGFQGQTSNNYFIYIDKSNASYAMNFYGEFNSVMGSSANNYSYFLYAGSSAVNPQGSENITLLMNDFTNRLCIDGNFGGAIDTNFYTALTTPEYLHVAGHINANSITTFPNIYYIGNYQHDNNINSDPNTNQNSYTHGFYCYNFYCNLTPPSSATAINVVMKKNYFKNLINNFNVTASYNAPNINSPFAIASSIKIQLTNTSNGGAINFSNNIINNCSGGPLFFSTMGNLTEEPFNGRAALEISDISAINTFTLNGNAFVNNTNVAFVYSSDTTSSINIQDFVMQNNAINWQPMTYGGGNVNINLYNTLIGATNNDFVTIGLIGLNGKYSSMYYALTCFNGNPSFIDPLDDNFGWFASSGIEQFPVRNYTNFAFNNCFLTPELSNPGGSATIQYRFLQLQGFAGSVIVSSNQSPCTLQYCNVIGGLIGVLSQNININVLNSTIGSNQIINNRIGVNGIGIRENCATQSLIGNIQNCIMQYNNTALEINSGVNLQNNTIINNNYGVVSLFQGFYAQPQYSSTICTIQNNIIMLNNISDYVMEMQTSYNYIGTRYYDLLPLTDPDYYLTQGTSDLSNAPLLDPVYLYPALQIMGYFNDSSAFGAASDNQSNIGARNLNNLNHSGIINALPVFSSYIFYDTNGSLNSGNVYSSNFWALENPNSVKYGIEALNPSSIKLVDGTYMANPTGYNQDEILTWKSAGKDSRISENLKTAIMEVYQTLWVCGISEDYGQTWTYYKIDKSSPLSFEPQEWQFYLNAYGGINLHFILQPAFNISKYTVVNP